MISRDEILKMKTGRELDSLIAKLIFPEREWPSLDPDDFNFWLVPQWSTNIKYAWELVEWMIKKDTIYIYLYEDGCSIMHGFYQDNLVSTDTAPHAICLAALLLHEKV